MTIERAQKVLNLALSTTSDGEALVALSMLKAMRGSGTPIALGGGKGGWDASRVSELVNREKATSYAAGVEYGKAICKTPEALRDAIADAIKRHGAPAVLSSACDAACKEMEWQAYGDAVFAAMPRPYRWLYRFCYFAFIGALLNQAFIYFWSNY